jgi:hypothetical protein
MDAAVSRLRTPPPSGGIAWLVAISAALALALGVGIEFFLVRDHSADIVGAAAAIGAGAALAAAVAGHGLRAALRNRTAEKLRHDDAGDHA